MKAVPKAAAPHRGKEKQDSSHPRVQPQQEERKRQARHKCLRITIKELDSEPDFVQSKPLAGKVGENNSKASAAHKVLGNARKPGDDKRLSMGEEKHGLRTRVVNVNLNGRGRRKKS